MLAQTLNVPIDPMTMLVITTVVVISIAAVGHLLARRKLSAIQAAGHELRSTPDYYAWYALVLMFLPSVLLSVLAAVSTLLKIHEISSTIIAAVWIVVPALLLIPAIRAIRPDLNARLLVERVVHATLFAAALVSIVTTIGILLSVVFESIRFFRQVSVLEFITGTTWAPGAAFLEGAGRSDEGASQARFGAVPLFAGTLMITGVAMLVAVPVGLFSAVYMSEYATKHFRRAAKPVIEILAGIPTVVYGFFAAITVAPVIVDAAEAVGVDASYQNAIAPGAIMGIMIIPYMSSLCDDVMTSVPHNIRNASMALGATKSETIKKVVLPAALPGIISAFLLSVSRAIGETMIVVMAAGLQANLSPNPLEQMTTVTVHIVANLTGDLAYDNPQTLSAFSLGLTLLIGTLALNIVSAVVIRKFRQRYEGD